MPPPPRVTHGPHVRCWTHPPYTDSGTGHIMASTNGSPSRAEAQPATAATEQAKPAIDYEQLHSLFEYGCEIRNLAHTYRKFTKPYLVGKETDREKLADNLGNLSKFLKALAYAFEAEASLLSERMGKVSPAIQRPSKAVLAGAAAEPPRECSRVHERVRIIVYQGIFETMLPNAEGRVSASRARRLFQQARPSLSSSQLADAWRLSHRKGVPKTENDREGIFRALDFIALAQAGKTISSKSLEKAKPTLELPTFESISNAAFLRRSNDRKSKAGLETKAGARGDGKQQQSMPNLGTSSATLWSATSLMSSYDEPSQPEQPLSDVSVAGSSVVENPILTRQSTPSTSRSASIMSQPLNKMAARPTRGVRKARSSTANAAPLPPQARYSVSSVAPPPPPLRKSRSPRVQPLSSVSGVTSVVSSQTTIPRLSQFMLEKGSRSRERSKSRSPQRSRSPSRAPEDRFESKRHMFAHIAVGMERELTRDRMYHFRWHRRVFIADEAVSWMISNDFAKNVKEAQETGNAMLEAGYIKHISKKNKPFKDDTQLFKVTLAEKDRALVKD